MNKDRHIVSELRHFFAENGCGLGIQRIMNKFGSYWFETGTPSYLVYLLHKHDYNLEQMSCVEADDDVMIQDPHLTASMKNDSNSESAVPGS